MKKVNLRDLYPDVYKTDAFLEVTDEVQAVFQSDERAEAAYERKMYRYKAQYSWTVRMELKMRSCESWRRRRCFWRKSSCASRFTPP